MNDPEQLLADTINGRYFVVWRHWIDVGRGERIPGLTEVHVDGVPTNPPDVLKLVEGSDHPAAVELRRILPG